METITVPVTVSYDGSRFHYSGPQVHPWPSPDGPYTSIVLPKLDPGSRVTVEVEAIGGLELGTSPVQWVALDTTDPSFLRPLWPDPRVIEVRPGDPSRVSIEVVVQDHPSGYRFMLVTYTGGRALFADPTIIDPPKGS